MKNLRKLSLRIKNIRSIQKTTKIMQMVSAVKLLESKKKLSNSKLYISKLYGIISLLISSIDQESLARVLSTTANYQDYSLVFIIASDRGLCGHFNTSIIRFSQEHINKIIINGGRVDIVFFGKKAFFDISKNNFGAKNILKIESSRGVMLNHVESSIGSINFAQYSKINVCYNKFYNTFIQKPTLEIIKPWNKNSSLIDQSVVGSAVIGCVYEYEPQNIEFILRFLIKNYVTVAIYSALLESAASENSARMVAMELANKNTKDMLEKLLFLYNRSRQSTITTDLIEIICGTESL